MMLDYYRKRAAEYDSLYETAAWRDELAVLRDWLVAHAIDRTILEVSAGTGYWTAVAAPVAKAITATDINAETLAIAAARNLGDHVALVRADAWCLPHTPGRCDLGKKAQAQTRDHPRHAVRSAGFPEAGDDSGNRVFVISFAPECGLGRKQRWRASVRRHRRAQGDRSTLRSIRPKRARPALGTVSWLADQVEYFRPVL